MILSSSSEGEPEVPVASDNIVVASVSSPETKRAAEEAITVTEKLRGGLPKGKGNDRASFIKAAGLVALASLLLGSEKKP